MLLREHVALALPLPKWYANCARRFTKTIVALALPLPKWYALKDERGMSAWLP